MLIWWRSQPIKSKLKANQRRSSEHQFERLGLNWEKLYYLLGMAFPCSTSFLYFSIKFGTIPCTPVRSSTWLTIHFWFLDVTKTFQFLFWKIKISFTRSEGGSWWRYRWWYLVLWYSPCPYQDRVVDRIGWHDPKVTFRSIPYQLQSQRKFWFGMGIQQGLRSLYL